MTIDDINMGEQPIFATKAHVFHIDPKTKRSWIPASSQAINVSFFFDSTRSLYRIISVEGTKAVINSTITPNMTFTKTSQKFGQWSDIRANTVYGLGFGSEADLNSFIEKFQEVKEATRQTTQTNGTASSSNTLESSSPLNASPAKNSRASFADDSMINVSHQLDGFNIGHPADLANSPLLKSSAVVAHQRSQSLSGLQPPESPKHQPRDGAATPSGTGLPQSGSDAQLKYENDRLKLALAQSSANAKKWEIELQTLKNNNIRLTSALQESTANVEEWKKQLQTYKDENTRLKNKMMDMECNPDANDLSAELKKELSQLRNRCEANDMEKKQKDAEIERVKKRVDELQQSNASNFKSEERLMSLQTTNEMLSSKLGQLQLQFETNKKTEEQKTHKLDTLHTKMGQKIQELGSLHRESASTISSYKS